MSCNAGGLLWAESGDVVILVAALALFGLGDAFHAGAGGWMGGGGGGGGAPLNNIGGGAILKGTERGGRGGLLNSSGDGIRSGTCSADLLCSLTRGGLRRRRGGAVTF